MLSFKKYTFTVQGTLAYCEWAYDFQRLNCSQGHLELSVDRLGEVVAVGDTTFLLLDDAHHTVFDYANSKHI